MDTNQLPTHNSMDTNQLPTHNLMDTLIRPSSSPYDGLSIQYEVTAEANYWGVTLWLFWVYHGFRVCWLFAIRILSLSICPVAFRADSYPSSLWACAFFGRLTYPIEKTPLFIIYSAFLTMFLNGNLYTCEILKRIIDLHPLTLSLPPPLSSYSPKHLQKLFEIQLPWIINVHH